MSFVVLHSTSISLPVPLSYFSSVDISHIFPYIFLHLLSPPATSNFSLPAPPSFIFLHVQLPAHHDVTRLLLLSTSHFLVHIPSPSSIFHSFSLNYFTPAFFISSTTLITSSSLLLAFFIFSNKSTSGLSTTTLYIL